MMASNGARPAVGRPPWGPLPVDDHDQRHLTTPSPSVATATHPPGSPAITKTADTAPVDAIAVIPSMGWTAAGGLVLRIDPVTRHTVVVPGIEIVAPPVVGLAAGAGTVWATTTAGRPLLRVDPGTARAAASLSVPAQAVAADRSGVWVRGTGRLLWRIDPTSNRVVATIPLPSGPTYGGRWSRHRRARWGHRCHRGCGVGQRPGGCHGVADRSRHNRVDGTGWEAVGSELAVAAAGDGGLWLGTAQGLFHVDQRLLREE
jgi:hypothetical protein